jgi:anti-anti-sigma regulatory factor
MKVYLIVAKGKRKGFPILIQGDLFLIGSEPICQLRSVLPGVASRHCMLVVKSADERKVFLRDLGSDEGTFINGSRMHPAEEWALHKGDRILVGPLEFMIQFTEKAFQKNDAEEWALKCLDGQDDERELLEDLEMMQRKKNFVNASAAAQGILDKLTAQKGIVQGRLRVSKEGAVTVVRLLDTFVVDEAEIALLRKELIHTLNQPQLRVLLDFKTVKRLSTGGIEMFAELAQHIKGLGGTLAFCRVPSDLAKMMHVLPALNGVRYYPDKGPALAASW